MKNTVMNLVVMVTQRALLNIDTETRVKTAVGHLEKLCNITKRKLHTHATIDLFDEGNKLLKNIKSYKKGLWVGDTKSLNLQLWL